MDKIKVNYSDKLQGVMYPFFVHCNRKKYTFEVTADGFMSPITGEIICTPGFPVTHTISLMEVKQLYTAAEHILFKHIELHA